MDTPDWTHLEGMFEKALALSGDERDAYVASVSAEDASVGAELGAMLRAYEAAPGFFDSMLRHMPGQKEGPSPPSPSTARATSYMQPGARVNQYEIEKELGAGGMGVVFKARDTRLNRAVALKFLPFIRRGDVELRQRFLQEAQAASALDHPNVCTIYEFNETEDGVHFIAMGYYPGETLKTKMKEPLPLEETLDYARQLVSGLAHAHEHGIVHRDIKPDNVMITKGGLVKVLDFGLAKMDGVNLTRTGMTMGTVAYMSPEQARGGHVDHRTDIWSVGVLMYELFTRERPFRGDYDQAVIYGILNETPQPPSEINPDLPPGLDAVVARCLEKDPVKRYGKTSELLEALERLDDMEAPPAPSVPVMRTPYWRRWPVVAAAVAGLLIVVVAFAMGPRLFRSGSAISDDGSLRLAVLPFTNMGADSALVGGLAFTITSKLALMGRFEGALSVVSSDIIQEEGIRTASAAAELLNANLALGGSVRRQGAGVQLTLQLVNALSNTVIDSRVVDVSPAEMGRFEDRIVENLAALLDLQLNTEAQQFLTAGFSQNPQAYSDYTRARGYLQQYEDASNIDASISLFKVAIKEDSSFTLAYAGLGDAYVSKYELQNRREWIDEAIRYGQRAIALDEDLGPVRLTMGRIYYQIGDYAEAERQFLRAYVLDGEDAEAQHQLARVYGETGDVEKAEEFYRRAVSLEQENWMYQIRLGNFYYEQHRSAEAIPYYQKVIELRPKNPWGYNNLAAQYQALGRIDEALASYQKAAQVNPSVKEPTAMALYNIGVIYYLKDDFAEAAAMFRRSLALDDTDMDYWSDLGSAYYWMGRRDSARVAWETVVDLAEGRLDVNAVAVAALEKKAFALAALGRKDPSLETLQRLLEVDAASPNTLLDVARVYEVLGDRENALAFLRRAYEGGVPVMSIEASPWFDALRDDPAYSAIVGR